MMDNETHRPVSLLVWPSCGIRRGIKSPFGCYFGPVSMILN